MEKSDDASVSMECSITTTQMRCDRFSFLDLSSPAVGFHVRRNLVLENLALRHQLLVLKRSIKNPALRNSDRLFWVALSEMWSRWTKVLVIVQPQTVVRWHQAGFPLFWRWRSRRRSGRTQKDRELIELIRRMWQADPAWGSPRISAELAKLGLEVSAATVRKYRPKGERRPRTQTWQVFLRDHTQPLIAVDFFTVPPARFACCSSLSRSRMSAERCYISPSPKLPR
jgi:hypothetical protein